MAQRVAVALQAEALLLVVVLGAEQRALAAVAPVVVRVAELLLLAVPVVERRLLVVPVADRLPIVVAERPLVMVAAFGSLALALEERTPEARRTLR
jgi:hypothetical protein